jgi:hypothetical protein
LAPLAVTLAHAHTRTRTHTHTHTIPRSTLCRAPAPTRVDRSLEQRDVERREPPPVVAVDEAHDGALVLVARDLCDAELAALRVCVRVCVRACVRACVCVRECPCKGWGVQLASHTRKLVRKQALVLVA